MKLVVFVLNRGELLQDVLTAYVEAGITGATVLDSEGMGRFLAYETPLFADFKDVMKESKPSNKTIFSIVQHDEKITILERLLDEICGGLDHPGTGIFFTLPVNYVHGMVREEEEHE
jgi:nitrogen regulatory protein P-II 1